MKNTHGFTLIEMLTVVLIIGILTGIALPQYRRAIQKAEATEAINLLRVIHDSGDRLAAEFGFRSFGTMLTASGDSDSEAYGKADFKHMDMFDETTIKCAFAGTTMTCDHFKYTLNSNNAVAEKLNRPNAGTKFVMAWTEPPVVKCDGTADACELYNLDTVN